jgi:hypothetical protein
MPAKQFKVREVKVSELRNELTLSCTRGQTAQPATVKLAPNKVDAAHYHNSTIFVQSGDAFLEFDTSSGIGMNPIRICRWLDGAIPFDELVADDVVGDGCAACASYEKQAAKLKAAVVALAGPERLTEILNSGR